MDSISNLIIKIKDKILEKFSELYMIIFELFNKENIGKMNKIVKEGIKKLNNSSNSIIHNSNSEKILKGKEIIINEILKNIKFEKYLSKYFEKTFLKIKEIKSKYINILVIGESGLGKSTLINSFLQIDKAKVGFGESITKTIGESYISENDLNKDFQLFDSYGFSKDEDFTITIDKIINFINKESTGQNLIHCIWYCVNGKRFFEKDKETIKKLLNTYTDDFLPIIIVHLQTLNIDESEEYFKKFNKFLGDDSKKLKFISVLAKDYEVKIGSEKKIIQSFGLKELKLMTKERISNAGNSYYYQNIRSKINEEYDYQIINKYEKIKGNIEKMIRNSNNKSMLFFNVEKYFERCLNLLNFNQNDKLIINSELNQIYRVFIDEINISYINEFNNQINKIVENIIKKCFPGINEKFKDKNELFLELIQEIRICLFEEVESNENEDFNIYDTQKDLKDLKIYNFSNLSKEVSENDIQKNKTDIFYNYDKGRILDESIKINEKNLTETGQTENTKYNIDKKDIYKLREIEFEIQKKILTFFSLEIINYIYKYLKTEGKDKINKLIDLKFKTLKQNLLGYKITIKSKNKEK